MLVDCPAEDGQRKNALAIIRFEHLSETNHSGAHPRCYLGVHESLRFLSARPGVIISCRDEHWLVSNVALTADGFRIRARGVSDYVRDTTATFFTALDDIAVFDPANVAVTPGESSLFRHIRLWLESTLRRTPVPLYQKQLEVATQMLADLLDYQLSAVKLAISDERL